MLSGAAHERGGASNDAIVIKVSSPVYKEACKALPPIPKNTEYRATLLSRLATWFAAGCDIPAGCGVHREDQILLHTTLRSTVVTSRKELADL